MEYSINISYIKLIHWAVQVSYILNDFLPAKFLDYYKRGMKTSNYIVNLSSSSCSSVKFLTHLFWCSFVRCMHVEDYYLFMMIFPLYHYVKTLLIPDNFLALKYTLSEVNRANQIYFWILLAWSIFFHSFSFNLPMSLYLKWVSCRKQIFFYLLWQPDFT